MKGAAGNDQLFLCFIWGIIRKPLPSSSANRVPPFEPCASFSNSCDRQAYEGLSVPVSRDPVEVASPERPEIWSTC